MKKSEILGLGIERGENYEFVPPKEPLQDPGPKKKPFNRKTGHRVATFSIPAIASCTGKTPACTKGCYAMVFTFRLQWARLMYLWEWTRRASFVGDVARQIKRDRFEIVRPHVAGDMYSATYAAKWLDVFARCAKTKFYFYTRSWRKKDGTLNRRMILVFRAMAALPNVCVWFSEDRETGPSPRIEGIRVAFTCFHPSDEALVPDDAHLVFRDTRRLGAGYKQKFDPAKWINGVWVCPVEQDQRRKSTVTCSTCEYCFVKRAMPKSK